MTLTGTIRSHGWGGIGPRMCWISWGIDPEGIGPHESPWPEHKSSVPNVAIG